MPEICKTPMNLYRGVPFTGSITWKPGGTAADLTGMKATANLHSGTPEEPGDVVYAITTDNGKLEIASPATLGKVTFALTGANVSDYAPGDYIMLLFFLNSSDVVIANGHPLIRYVKVFNSGVDPS